MHCPSVVYSGDIEWQPEGTQSSDPNFESNPPKPYLDKILLAKMRPGQVRLLFVKESLRLRYSYVGVHCM